MAEHVNEQTQLSNETNERHAGFAEKTRRLFSGAFSSLRDSYTMELGVDLGTSTTLITVKGKGIVLDEPSVVAVDKETKRVLGNGKAVGHIAYSMLGKTPRDIEAIRPMRDGVISNFEAAEAMLACFIQKVKSKGKYPFCKPRVTIAIPSGVTEVERHAVIDSAERIGASKVILIDEPMAAGIGSGLPVSDPNATMVVDIGAGTTEVAVLSIGGIAACKSLRIGGNAMDEAIIKHIRKTYKLEIGHRRAEDLKKKIGSAGPFETSLNTEVHGRDTISGMPRKVSVTSLELCKAFQGPVGEIIDSVMTTLEELDPELAADLIKTGIYLCGGGSKLRNVAKVLRVATGLKITQIDQPQLAVAKGTERYMQEFEHWQDVVNSFEEVNEYAEPLEV